MANDTAQYNYYYQPRREMLAFVPEGCRTMLEVGCGDGTFAEQLKTRPDTAVWGVELHEASAAIASQRIDKAICGDFLALASDGTLPAGYFDCLVFNDSLEHFPHYREVLDASKRLLTPGGYIVASLPNFRYVGNLWEILIEKDFQYKSSGVLDYTHYRFFTMKSIRRMFAEAGFEVLKCEGINATSSLKVRVLNILAFNFLNDIKYLQIATLARLK